jgi:Ca2+-binding EF-hand superfamily protein
MSKMRPGQLEELRDTFQEYDEDGDGRISFAEFAAMLEELDDELSRDEQLLAFEATDSDGDGAIGFDEFVAWWTGP